MRADFPSGPLHNFTATSDPTASNDSTQGYSAGSMWLNTATGLMFRSRSAAAGAAAWTPIDISDHVGHVTGAYCLPFGFQRVLGAAATANTMRATLGTVKQRITISELWGRVTSAVAGSNFQLAVYSVDPTTKLPKTLFRNTASLSGAAVAMVSGALAGGNLTLEPGTYWFVFNSDNAQSFMSVDPAGLNHVQMMGSATLGGNLMSSTQNFTGKSVAQTFGTWPADASAMGWADATVTFAVGFKIASVP